MSGATDARPVRGLTHNFYKYPARFSPAFVRAAIEVFTMPGDLIVDPHVGGGTTLVEAIALGRDAIGIDISPLAQFVATTKSTVYSEKELIQLKRWIKQVTNAIHMGKRSTKLRTYEQLGYYKHLHEKSRWRLRKAIEQAMASAMKLKSNRLESFGRCAVLRAAQWALDGKGRPTSVKEFRDHLAMSLVEMIEGARELRAVVRASSTSSKVKVVHRKAAGMERDPRINSRPPKLIVTSPPYPGVHVLYHRWQVDGRKETPLPFMIAGKLDGAPSSHYTMGDRKAPGLNVYFENLVATMSSAAAIADDQTIFVQMVAFSDPVTQLPRYLSVMKEAGLYEIFLPSLSSKLDGRLWRRVPGRRWYSEQRGETPGSREVVLIHRKICEGTPSLTR